MRGKSREITLRFPDDFLGPEQFDYGWKVNGNDLEAALKARKIDQDLVIHSEWISFDLQKMAYNAAVESFNNQFWDRFFG